MKKILCLGLLICWSFATFASELETRLETVVDTLMINDLTMQEAAQLIATQCDVPIIVSKDARDIIVNCQFKNIKLADALDALSRANGLWYRIDERTQVIHIQTLDEFKKTMRLGGSERVEVIQVMYPNVIDVGETLSQLYASKVVWSPTDEFSSSNYQRIQAALSRMDILAQRGSVTTHLDQESSSSDGSSNSYSNSYGSNNNSYGSTLGNGFSNMGMTSFTGLGNRSNNNNNQSKEEPKEGTFNKEFEKMSLPQLANMVRELDHKNSLLYNEITSNPGVVYMTAMNESNKLMLRSADPAAIEQMIKIIAKLDTPSPQVLLEVKVLEVTLDDAHEHAIDFLFGDAQNQFGFSDDAIRFRSPEFNSLTTPFEARSAVFSTISENFAMKLKFLNTENRATALATPNLLVSDNEASNIFIGKEMTVLQKAQPSSAVLQGTTGSLAGVGGTMIDAPRMRVGTTLLLTPKIHPDRSVTLRVMQEQSYPAEQPRRIVYAGTSGTTTTAGDGTTTGTTVTSSPTEQYFESTDIELQTITTTVVAQDQNLIVIGGLIRESVDKKEEKIPFFGDIPYIGEALFSRVNSGRKRSELLVIIRPFVLLVPGEADKASRSFFERMSQHPSAIGDIPSLGVNYPEEIAKPHHVNPDDPWVIRAYDQMRNWSVDDAAVPIIERASEDYHAEQTRLLTAEELKRIESEKATLKNSRQIETNEVKP